jgi:hypothetical protein
MKKKLMYTGLIIIIITTSIIIGSNTNFKKEKESDNKETIFEKNHQNIKTLDEVEQSKKYALKCKTCHATEYPTKKDPGLVNCPRTEMVSVYHSAKEGPEIVILDQIVDRYNPVVFSHKLHAEMSEMTGGCSSCHHYNTTGPVLACNTCHEPNRLREDISKPDLSAAYHRQCVNCHRQWQRETECNTCHEPKSPNFEEKVNKLVNETKGRYHPEVSVPNKFIYETTYEKGKLVTFFHKEHTELYKAPCTTCHTDESCMKCHDVKMKNNGHLDGKPTKVHKTFDDHHNPCSTCHKDDIKDKCSKCHSDKEISPFNHSSTGWPLGKFHSNLKCGQCHGNQTPIKKIDNRCNSCHKDFVPNKFNHKKAGIVLSENHKDLDCESCHPKGQFSKAPTCNEGCHDDKNYPKDLPGKRVK